MTEGTPKPNPDQLHQEEVLAEGRSLYDAARRLFDASNDAGLRVRYLGRETARPHESDRVIHARFEPTEGDTVSIGPNVPRKVSEYFVTPIVDVALRIYPSSQQARSLTPDGISLRLRSQGDQSSGYGGILLPDGSVAPSSTTEDETRKVFNAIEAHAAFRLLQKLIDEKRLKPHTKDDFEIVPVRRTSPVSIEAAKEDTGQDDFELHLGRRSDSELQPKLRNPNP